MTTAVTVHDPQVGGVMNAPTRGGLVRLAAPMKEIMAQHAELEALIKDNLEEGPNKDYGPAPGAKDNDSKRILYKSGAEKVAKWHGCFPQYEIIEKEAKHDVIVPYRKKKYNNAHKGDRTFTETDGESLGLYRYVVRCSLIYRATGEIVGDGIGICSTLESKYIDRPRDLENTVVKMAQKRALLAAVLNAFALSDRFTQDLEDMQRDDDTHVETQQTRSAGAQRTVTPNPDVDERGVARIPFGVDAIKGKAIDDVAAVTLELLFSTDDWLVKKGPEFAAKYEPLVEQLQPEIVRRVTENLATDDEYTKMLKWVLNSKFPARAERYADFKDALEEKAEREREQKESPALKEAMKELDAAEASLATTADAPAGSVSE